MYPACGHSRPDGAPYYELCLGVEQGTKKRCDPLITDTSQSKILPGPCPSCPAVKRATLPARHGIIANAEEPIYQT
ncbi:hypothetical protein Forpe1208_v017053 [Fusarium oxysporum f. sp. rapae]|uniref:Uncharacterized protein n=1 Tax=Fusarium oxysporum f. sp. rapae TaxID=485398 RepID=A0A8J5TWJ6_FUSOX|nr:hypothetical protein Forpe1208_v017064 [Fusarium oxysporum f. sp. rapae]KAG7402619.1 hypothetical protein Forpe1208_v017175 [Fusarium oxysporum f. sp. rapae]KAG7402680.1 hypothetical protein Forpe1208_v017053 [Fusarium oxysporum f. sp. rapae]